MSLKKAIFVFKSKFVGTCIITSLGYILSVAIQPVYFIPFLVQKDPIYNLFNTNPFY